MTTVSNSWLKIQFWVKRFNYPDQLVPLRSPRCILKYWRILLWWGEVHNLPKMCRQKHTHTHIDWTITSQTFEALHSTNSSGSGSFLECLKGLVKTARCRCRVNTKWKWSIQRGRGLDMQWNHSFRLNDRWILPKQANGLQDILLSFTALSQPQARISGFYQQTEHGKSLSGHSVNCRLVKKTIHPAETCQHQNK